VQTRPRRLSNFWLLVGLVVPTALVLIIGAFTDPQARLVGLLVFLPALVAGQGTVRQTAFAGLWSTLTLLSSVLRFPEPSPIDEAVIMFSSVVFAAYAVISCSRQIAREQEIGRLRSTATALQREILRPLPQSDERVCVHGVYEPVQEERLVGGDIYDVASTEYGTRVLIGDVQGKGLAALGTGIAVIGAFREAAHRENTLSGLVEAMEKATRRHNGDAAHSGEPERFVTALVLCFDAGPEVRAVDCGHLPAYLVDDEGPRSVGLGESGVPLGLADLVSQPRRECRFELPEGTQLLLYTDGLTEARNGDGSFYPLEQRLALFSGLPAGGLAKALDEDVREFSHHPQDDLAILVVRRRDETEAEAEAAAEAAVGSGTGTAVGAGAE
jgi:hypothetical protein